MKRTSKAELYSELYFEEQIYAFFGEFYEGRMSESEMFYNAGL